MMLASMGDPSMGDPAAQADPGLGMGGVPDPTTSPGSFPTEMPVAPSTPIPGSELVRGVDQQTGWIGGTRHLTPDLSNPDAVAWPSAAVAAEDEAQSRGTPWAAQQRRSPTAYNDQQLIKLGLSPYEIRLLKLTGGSK